MTALLSIAIAVHGDCALLCVNRAALLCQMDEERGGCNLDGGEERDVCAPDDATNQGVNLEVDITNEQRMMTEMEEDEPSTLRERAPSSPYDDMELSIIKNWPFKGSSIEETVNKLPKLVFCTWHLS